MCWRTKLPGQAVLLGDSDVTKSAPQMSKYGPSSPASNVSCSLTIWEEKCWCCYDSAVLYAPRLASTRVISGVV